MHELLITITTNIHKNLEFSNYDDLEKTPPKVCTYSAESGEAFLLQEVDPNHNRYVRSWTFSNSQNSDDRNMLML